MIKRKCAEAEQQRCLFIFLMQSLGRISEVANIRLNELAGDSSPTNKEILETTIKFQFASQQREQQLISSIWHVVKSNLNAPILPSAVVTTTSREEIVPDNAVPEMMSTASMNICGGFRVLGFHDCSESVTVGDSATWRTITHYICEKMDSEYLKKNVLSALTEALTAMIAESPEDQVEFLGKYLICQTERSAVEAQKHIQALDAESTLARCAQDEKNAEIERLEKSKPRDLLAQEYSTLLGNLRTLTKKDQAMQLAVDFLETKMNIPSAYVAVRTQSEAGEFLKYLHAGPRSASMAGRKLARPVAEEGEDAPTRQGISFEAFKLPEVPEEDAGDADGDDDGSKPKRAPPELSPLIVHNAMRDSRVKFFGFPRLGAFAAFPVVYQSGCHDQACVFNAGDGEVPGKWEIAKKEAAVLLGIDTVGHYRLFESEEIDRSFLLAKTLSKVLEALDDTLCKEQMDFLNGPILKTLNDKAAEIFVTLGEKEVAAAAAAAAALLPPAPAEGEPAPESTIDPAVAELEKVQAETAAALSVWRDAISKTELALSFSQLSKFVLPLPAVALKLVYAIALLVNESPKTLEDVCGDPDWDVIRSSFWPALVSKIGAFQPSATYQLQSRSNGVAAVKAYLEANGLTDGGAYPSYLTSFGTILLTWLQKAIAARESAMVFQNEVHKVGLELQPFPK